MEAKFSPRVKDVLSFSREEALRLGNDFIGVEHFLLGILREGEGNAVKILAGFNLDLVQLKKIIDTDKSKIYFMFLKFYDFRFKKLFGNSSSGILLYSRFVFEPRIFKILFRFMK